MGPRSGSHRQPQRGPRHHLQRRRRVEILEEGLAARRLPDRGVSRLVAATTVLGALIESEREQVGDQHHGGSGGVALAVC
jgi:hypothetical protein